MSVGILPSPEIRTTHRKKSARIHSKQKEGASPTGASPHPSRPPIPQGVHYRAAGSDHLSTGAIEGDSQIENNQKPVIPNGCIPKSPISTSGDHQSPISASLSDNRQVDMACQLRLPRGSSNGHRSDHHSHLPEVPPHINQDRDQNRQKHSHHHQTSQEDNSMLNNKKSNNSQELIAKYKQMRSESKTKEHRGTVQVSSSSAEQFMLPREKSFLVNKKFEFVTLKSDRSDTPLSVTSPRTSASRFVINSHVPVYLSSHKSGPASCQTLMPRRYHNVNAAKLTLMRSKTMLSPRRTSPDKLDNMAAQVKYSNDLFL